MKHSYKPLILLILLASAMLFGTRSAPASSGVLAAAVPLPFQPQPHAPDHPALKEQMAMSPVRTLHPMTLFEREVRARSVFGYYVPRLVVIDGWVSPHEGRVHVELDARRWHRGAWRRLL